MKQDVSAQYRFHLRMWQVTDPYATAVEEDTQERVQDAPLPEVTALDALAQFFRRNGLRIRNIPAPPMHKRT